MELSCRIRNEEGTDDGKVATKFNFKSYETFSVFIVRFGITCGIEG